MYAILFLGEQRSFSLLGQTELSLQQSFRVFEHSAYIMSIINSVHFGNIFWEIRGFVHSEN